MEEVFSYINDFERWSANDLGHKLREDIVWFHVHVHAL